MKFTVEQIAAMLGAKYEGNGREEIFTLGKIQDAEKGSITFLSNPKYEPFIYDTKASAIIVAQDFEPKKPVNSVLIRVEDPYTAFTVLLEEYHKIISFSKKGIEQPSFVSESAKVGEDVYIGAFAYVGEKATIGNNVKIYPNAYIGDEVSIADNTIIYAGVKIYAQCKIGQKCVIHAGAVIGSDGFGFAPQQDGSYKTIPQLGNVIIEDNVDIGANTTIDCATLGSTVVKKGAKIDNLVQLAHNVEIGDNTVIAAQSGVSGSTKMGKNCVIAGQVGIVGHLEIADRTTLAAKTGLSKSIKKPDTIKFGYPALDHKEYMKSFALFKKLPELQERINELEKKVLNLQAD